MDLLVYNNQYLLNHQNIGLSNLLIDNYRKKNISLISQVTPFKKLKEENRSILIEKLLKNHKKNKKKFKLQKKLNLYEECVKEEYVSFEVVI